MYKKKNLRLIAWLLLFVLITEMFFSVDTYATTQTSGTVGANGGYQWSYDEETDTLRVTGEDVAFTRSIFESIYNGATNVVFEDCVFRGSLGELFMDKKSIKSIEFINCDTSNVTNMNHMFSNCTQIRSLDLSGFDTSKVWDMSSMFSGCGVTSLDLSGFDTSNVTTMEYMFWAANNMTSLDISGFDTSNVKKMQYMFSSDNLTNVDVSGFDTSKVINMWGMFAGCDSLTSLDLSGFDTSNVTNMSGMFSSCESLKSLDLSGFDTSNVTNMSGMFSECESLKSLDLSGFDTSNVTDMSSMFSGCGITSIDISRFDASNLKDMSKMFRDCWKLEYLDMSGLDLSKVKSTTYMLEKCYNIKTILTPKCGISDIDLPETMYNLENVSTNKINYKFYNTVLMCNIDEVSSKIVKKEKYLVKVVDEQGIPVDNAAVAYSDYCDKTDINGEVLIEHDKIKEDVVIEISKPNYTTVSLMYGECIMSGDYYEAILYDDEKGKYKLRDVYYYTTDLIKRNILKGTKVLNLKHTGNLVGDLTTGDFKIECKANDTENISEYELWQNNTMIASSKTGLFSLNVEQGFVEGGNCIVKVKAKDGTKINTEINLTFVKNEVKTESSISLIDESVKIAVSDDVPFFGGSDIEISMPELPVNYGYYDDKVFISFNIWDYDSSKGKTEKEFYDSIKEYIASRENVKSLKNAINKKDKIKELMKDDKKIALPGGKFTCKVVGYAEANIGDKMAKGQIYIEILEKFPTAGNTWCVVVPVTVQFNVSTSLQVKGEINYDVQNQNFDGSGLKLDIKINLHAFGGIGVGKFVGAGAYGDAILVSNMTILGQNKGLNNVDLTGQLGVEVYAGPFKFKRAFAYNTWHLHTKTIPNTLALSQALNSNISNDMYSAGNYTISSLDYLSNESNWYGYPIMMNDADATTNFMSLLENTYLNAQPVMVSDGDVLYAAFLGADQTTNEIYVQCTKMENGVWCEPVRVSNESILDGSPQLLVDDDGNICLAYATTNEEFDNSSLLSYAQNQSIVVGMLDKETLELTQIKEFDDVDYEHMQTLTCVNGNPTLLWVDTEVTDDDSVLAAKKHNIIYSSYEEGQWTETSILKNIDSYICDLAIGDSGVGYVIDTDDDLMTIEDRTLVYCDWEGNVQGTVAGVTGNVTYGTLPGETNETFIWNSVDELCSLDGAIDVAGITNEYVINDNSIYYSLPVEGGAELVVIRRNSDGTYSEPIQLTDTDRYIENLSVATAYGKDIILGMHTSADIVEDDLNTAKNLVWSIIQPVNDIRIDEITYDNEETGVGETITTIVTVTNAGENEVSEVKISLNGNVVATESVNLKAGESKDIAFEMQYPESLTEYTVKVEDTSIDLSSDYKPDDNSAVFELGHANVTVDAVLRKIGDRKTIVAELVNNGTAVASGTVALYDAEGNMISIKSFEKLAKDNMLLVEMPVDSEIADTTLSVVVTTAQEELYEYDNIDTVYVPVDSEWYTITYELNDGVQNELNPTFYFETTEEIQLYDPTRENYEFEGWYLDSEYTNKVTSIPASHVGEITLYARWTRNGMYVADDGNYYYYIDNEINTSANGLTNTNLGWVYFKNGMLDVTCTGLIKNENDWLYVKDGRLDRTYTGLAKNDYGWWYVKDGQLDRTYIGLGKNDYGWWYVKDGKVDLTFTGMAKNENGWFYVKNGKVDLNYTGLAENEHGTWYMEDGKVASNISGLTKVSKVWLYLTKGKVDTSFTGLAKNEYGWWYVKNGELDKTYTGMAKNENGWFYVKSGKVDLEYTGLAENEYGTWYMEDGKVASNISGLTKVSKVWMYLVKGKVDTDYVGLAKNESGWWYVENGTVDFTYTGMAKNQYGWWYVTNGKLDRTFTGISSNEYGSWYIKDGAVEKTYTGIVTYNGVTYNIKNGKVI